MSNQIFDAAEKAFARIFGEVEAEVARLAAEHNAGEKPKRNDDTKPRSTK